MKNKSVSLASIVLAAVLLNALRVNAGVYKYTDLGGIGAINSGATAINNNGQVTGWSSTSAATHATIWNGTKATDVDSGGNNYSAGLAINSHGEVAGFSMFHSGYIAHAMRWNGANVTELTPDGGTSVGFSINDIGQVAGMSPGFSPTGRIGIHATLWNGAIATDLGTLGGDNSRAYGINDNGQLVGSSELHASSYSHATLWNDAVPTDLGTLGGAISEATAINNKGQIVGWSMTTYDILLARYEIHAALWDGLTAFDLGTLGGGLSQASSLNNKGEVVGFSTTPEGAQHAAFWDGVDVIDLNSFLDSDLVNAGWILSSASGINDTGSIVGLAVNFSTGSQQTHAFLLSNVGTVPEPGSIEIMILGLAMVGLFARRWRLYIVAGARRPR